jgi:hypothetical protein
MKSMTGVKKFLRDAGVATLAATLAFVFGSGVFIGFAAWSEPTEPPPNANAPEPLNVSATSQYKSGALGVGGVLRGYANSVFDGSVGIGTSLPSYKLDIHGHQADTRARIEVNDDNTVGLLIQRTGATNPVAWYLQSPGGTTNLRLSGGGTNVLEFTTAGNVGIGTTAPGQRLSVGVTSPPFNAPSTWEMGVNGSVFLGRSGGGYFSIKDFDGDATYNTFISRDNSMMLWHAGNGLVIGQYGNGATPAVGNEGLLVKGNAFLAVTGGNVGVGTAGPAYRLDVAGEIRTTVGVRFPDNSVQTSAAGASVPSGMIALFDAACPAGWTRYGALDNRFPRGIDPAAETVGATGGSEQYRIWAFGEEADCCSGQDVVAASRLEWIGEGQSEVSGFFDGQGWEAGNTEIHRPRYVNMVYCKKN